MFSTLACACHIVQDPLNFGAGEIGVNHQASGVMDLCFQAIALEFLANTGGATALPDDGIVDRLAGFFFPDNGRLTLIGDADTGDLIGVDIGLRQHFYTIMELCDAQISSGSCSTQPAFG